MQMCHDFTTKTIEWEKLRYERVGSLTMCETIELMCMLDQMLARLGPLIQLSVKVTPRTVRICTRTL